MLEEVFFGDADLISCSLSLPLSLFLPLSLSLSPSPSLPLLSLSPPLPLPLSLSLSLCVCRLTQVLKAEASSKALYYFCELHRKGGSRQVAKNYCNKSLELDPNAPGPLHALGLFSFGEYIV